MRQTKTMPTLDERLATGLCFRLTMAARTSGAGQQLQQQRQQRPDVKIWTAVYCPPSNRETLPMSTVCLMENCVFILSSSVAKKRHNLEIPHLAKICSNIALRTGTQHRNARIEKPQCVIGKTHTLAASSRGRTRTRDIPVPYTVLNMRAALWCDVAHKDHDGFVIRHMRSHSRGGGHCNP